MIPPRRSLCSVPRRIANTSPAWSTEGRSVLGRAHRVREPVEPAVTVHGEARQIETEGSEVDALVSATERGASEQGQAPGATQDQVADHSGGVDAPPALVHAHVEPQPEVAAR